MPRLTKPSTTAFPLPLPRIPAGVFGGFPKLSRRRLLRLCRARLLQVTVFALNFVYLGRYPTLAELGREPSPVQVEVFERLRALLAVCGSSGESFLLASGRSFPELGAKLLQLEHFVGQSSELRQSYLDGPVGFREDPNLLPTEEYPQLMPYRSLDSSRLKIVGEGKWPMSEYLRGALWLPFQEPAFLRHGLPVDFGFAPNFRQESRSECLKLMKVWDSKGLLQLFPAPAEDGQFCRVFNAYKSPTVDRQIGDRRLVNMSERSFDGPSQFLPPGQMLTQLKVSRFKEYLCASVTDRRDFYHQAQVSSERCQSNLLPFAFGFDELEGLSALDEYLHGLGGRGPSAREVVGDKLESAPKIPQKKASKPVALYGGFRSLFQGDHLGVEFALCAHQNLLEDGGLLLEGQQIRGHHGFPKGPIYSGLVIDDFFLVSRECRSCPCLHSAAARALACAREVYRREGLLGSEEKDVEGQRRFKAVGAEVISDEKAVDAGCVTVAAPVAKRLALSYVSLRAAALPGLTPHLVSRLAGNWTSVLMYRRCLCAAVDNLFAFGTRALDSDPKVVLPLPRSVCRELVVLASLAPLMCSNVAVSYLGRAFATDASLAKGAVVSASVDPEVCEELWLDTEKKGSYVMLDSGFREMLKHLGDFEIEEIAEPPLVRPKASPPLYFDFVEFCGGVGAVSSAATKLGLVVAPPLDLSASRHYNMEDLRLLEWAIFMITEGRFRSFLLEPPCTSFSPAAYPCVRSYRQPYMDFAERTQRFGGGTAWPSVPSSSCELAGVTGARVVWNSLVGLRWLGCRSGFPCLVLVSLLRRSWQHVSSGPPIRRSFGSCCSWCQRQTSREGAPVTILTSGSRESTPSSLQSILRPWGSILQWHSKRL